MSAEITGSTRHESSSLPKWLMRLLQAVGKKKQFFWH